MRNRRDVKKPMLAVGAVVLIVAVCLIVYISGQKKVIVPDDSPLSVYFFDVGQGDCGLIRCEGVNVLLGDNGQGKTNVLEALYLCCTGRSHRTRQDREMIRDHASPGGSADLLAMTYFLYFMETGTVPSTVK